MCVWVGHLWTTQCAHSTWLSVRGLPVHSSRTVVSHVSAASSISYRVIIVMMFLLAWVAEVKAELQRSLFTAPTHCTSETPSFGLLLFVCFFITRNVEESYSLQKLKVCFHSFLLLCTSPTRHRWWLQWTIESKIKPLLAISDAGVLCSCQFGISAQHPQIGFFIGTCAFPRVTAFICSCCAGRERSALHCHCIVTNTNENYFSIKGLNPHLT